MNTQTTKTSTRRRGTAGKVYQTWFARTPLGWIEACRRSSKSDTITVTLASDNADEVPAIPRGEIRVRVVGQDLLASNPTQEVVAHYSSGEPVMGVKVRLKCSDVLASAISGRRLEIAEAIKALQVELESLNA